MEGIINGEISQNWGYNNTKAINVLMAYCHNLPCFFLGKKPKGSKTWWDDESEGSYKVGEWKGDRPCRKAKGSITTLLYKRKRHHVIYRTLFFLMSSDSIANCWESEERKACKGWFLTSFIVVLYRHVYMFHQNSLTCRAQTCFPIFPSFFLQLFVGEDSRSPQPLQNIDFHFPTRYT